MKFNKIGLLTMLISLFILTACENPNGVGLDINPQDKIQGVLTDTSTIRSFTVKEEDILTNSLREYPLGFLKDPELGSTEANIATYFSLGGTSNVTFGTSPTLDSAVLALKLGNEFYGDSLNSDYVIEVHQLSDKFDKTKRYLNTQAWNFNSTVIGSKTVNYFHIKDSVIVQKIIPGKPDENQKVAPQIRISLDASFITANFLNAPSAKFVSNETFLNHLKGFYITINKTASTGTGGIAFFDLSQGSQIELYYKKQNAAATGVDTVSNQFPTNYGAAYFTHDYTGTNVETQLNNPTQQAIKTYTQSLSGVRTKLNFPYLTKLKELGNVIINKAELVVPIANNSDNTLAPATRLFLYQTDIAGQRTNVPDISNMDLRMLSDLAFGGYYDKVNKRYVFTLTSYVQDIISGRSVQYDTYIAPIEPGVERSTASFPSATTGGRSVITTRTTPNLKMKLNIYYTKLN